jgi:hypothetical protein
VQAFGAGILSSYGEMEHMAAGKAKLLPFDPFAPQPKMSYKDGFQKVSEGLPNYLPVPCLPRKVGALSLHARQ